MLKYNSSLYQSAKTVFNGIEIIPGERLILLCSRDMAFRITPDQLISRFSQREIHASYLVPQYLRIKLLRQGYIRERLEENRDLAAINRDYLPYGFFLLPGALG